MQKAIETSNGLKGGLLKGKAHYDSNGNPLGGIKAVVTDQGGKPIEVEGSEVIINKKTVQSEKVLTVKGTPKEILSTLNQMDGNGVAIGDEEAEILAKYRIGGEIPREKQIYLGKEGGSNVSSKGMFESAVQMENEGIDSETIRSITGWFRNPFDKLWRFEISDENMEIIFDFDSEKLVELESFNNPKLAYKTPLKKVIIHNELFKAYPSIKDLEICFIFDKNSDVASLNVDSNNNVTININLYGNRFRVLPSLPRLNRGADFKAVITHELQHVIQVREGLSGGSSIKQEHKKLLSSLPTNKPTRMEVGSSREDFLWGLARRNYLNSLGEIESRDSQERVYFDKKTRIEIPPYSLINFNNEEVIVVPETKIKFDEGGRIPREKQIYLGKEGGSNVSPKGMFESAIQMENEGIDSETIRSITGWFRSELDGLWRYEISDKEMEIICTFTDKEINHLKTKNNYIQKHLKDVIKHEELFKAYPRIKYLKVLFVDSNNSDAALLDVSNEGVMFIICNLKYEREISDNRGGTEELGEREISDNRRSGEERKVKRYNTLHFRKVITHELQHAIQINEGLAEGGNTNVELKKLKANSGAIQSLTEKEQEYIATQRYLNKAGEIEAMSSDVRIDYNDLQRIRNKPYSEIAIDPKYFSSDLETKIKFREGGELIKRADGSYSRRGLWDNIRDNVGSGRKPTKQMLEQEAKIKSKYHLGGDMSKHLAPNGKPSNLTHEQWHLVRTPEFLDFFGNWINSPETASKVVDENGEPLVCYHGTKNKNINTFNNVNYNEIYEYDAYGIYSSESIENAKHYSGDTGNVISIFVDIKNPYNLGTRETDKGRPTDKNLRAITKERYEFYIEKEYDGVIFTDLRGIMFEIVALKPNQIKLADGTNTTFDENNDDIRFAEGGSISKMTPSELKAFYDTPEGKKLDAQTYAEWSKLVNMTKSELEKFYNSVEGKEAGLSPEEAKEQGINYGRKSARWIMKMKDIPYTQWTSNMWKLAKKQIDFIKRMTGMRGKLYNDKGEKTRRHTALLIWGHNPEEKFTGGGGIKRYDNFKNPILINGFISNKKIDGKEIFLITYNSGGQEGLNVHQTMNPLAMLDAVEKKTGLHTNTLQVFIYEHTENSNRIETEDELEFLKDNYTVIIVDRDSVEFYNGLKRFKGGGELSKKALAVETNDLTDFVRKYFISDGRIDVSDAMQELFGNKRGKSIADEYRKRIGLHKKGGLTISQLAHNLWEQHRDEVREGIDDSDFRNAVEEVLISEYGVASMIKSLMEKSEGNEQDRENEFWMNQFDEGDDEYYEDLSDEEVADYFKDMEGFERETYKDEDKKIIISGVEIPKEIDELFKEKYELDYYYSFYGKILNSFPKDEMGLITDLAKNTKEYKDVKQKYDLAKRKADNFNTSKEGKELIKFQGKIRDRMDRMEISRHYRDLAEELAKGTEHEMEHLETLKKVAEGKITPEEAVVQTSLTHIKENPNYYEDLAKMEAENEGIKIGAEFYDYYEPIKQRVVSFDSERVFSVPVNIPKSEQDDYRLKRIFKIDKFKEILSKQDEFEAEINESETNRIKAESKKSEQTQKEADFKKAVSSFVKGDLEIGKAIKSLDQVHKINGELDTLKNHIEKFVSEIKDPIKVNIRDIDGKPHFSEDKMSYTPLVNRSGEKYFEYLLNLKKQTEQQEESIPELIEGLEILLESLEGEEKKDLEDTIEGLKLLL